MEETNFASRHAVKPSVLAWVRVMRLYNAVSRLGAAQLAQEGLSGPRFDVLAQLGVLGGACAAQDALVRRLMVTKGNVSTLIHKMVQDGLISRKEDPANRRRNRLALTPKGETLRRRAVPRHEQWLDELFSVLSPREQKALEALLTKLLSGIKKCSELQSTKRRKP